MASPVVTDDLVLKVHTGPDGRVWVLDGDRRPEDSGLLPEAFALDRAFDRERVRVLGLPGDVSLAVQLYALARTGRRTGTVEVASPLAVRGTRRRAAPVSVLMDMRQWVVRPSVGGWTEFGADHFVSFSLALATRRRAQAGEIAELLARHPAWGAVSLVPHLDGMALAHLIGQVLDPRFFVDPDEPDRLSKLEAFLGLDPKVAQTGGRTAGCNERYARYRLLLEAWKRDDPGPAEAGRNPALFVWRAYYAAGGGPKGDLCAGRRLAHYLRHTWLDGLYPGRPHDPLFSPDMFFDGGGAAWYRKARGLQ
jgi:hypothetical protein